MQSYTTRYTNDNISVKGSRVKLPKLGWMRLANSRACEGRILSATVRRNASGKYFVSIVCEVDIQPLPKTDQEVGIDLGIQEFAVCSNGMRVANPKAFRTYEKKLGLWQRRMARRSQRGSNWQKAKQKVAQIHEIIANCRHENAAHNIKRMAH